MTKLHYFEQNAPDADDFALRMAVHQGYVPETCLLNGSLVLHEVGIGNDPCAGCEGPRLVCGGRARKP